MKKNEKEKKIKEMQEKILRTLSKTPGLRKRELMRRTKAKEREVFYAALESLFRSGEIMADGRGRQIKLSQKGKTIRAQMVSLSRGFGFARPLDDGEDIFIPGSSLGDAMVGDTVALRNVHHSSKGMSAEIASISERGARTTTGTVIREGGDLLFRADLSVRYPMKLSRDSIRVREGDKVMAELFLPRRRDEYRACIIKRYGSADSAKICADAILEQNEINTSFPEDVIREAEQVAAEKPDEKVLKGRLDLREKSIYTIDGEDARDLDDAISVSRTRSGYRLGVHIADVSHYVRPDSLLDKEAFQRGTSVYFPDRVIPMLPVQLSNGVCSLNAGEDKLTLSALIDFDKQGKMLSFRFRKSVIRSKVRGVYSEVNQLFSNCAGKELKKKYAPVIRSLHAARELALLLKERARQAGKIDFESTEPKFTLDGNGVCVDAEPRKHGEAEELIEQFMIAANRAAAMLARENGIPFVYRVHEPPQKERVEELIRLAELLGIPSQNLHQDQPKTADFAKMLELAKGTPAEKILSYQVLRTMEKAKYLPEPKGHFGLALSDYCHFTSPIRRYPDTVVHRILSALLSREKPQEITGKYASFVQKASKQSSQREIVAVNAERAADSCFMAEFMRGHIGEEFDGIISSVTQRGIFVELESGAEGLIPVEGFEGARMIFDGMLSYTDEVTGKRFTVGQPIRILVAASEIASGRIDFLPAAQKENL